MAKKRPTLPPKETFNVGKGLTRQAAIAKTSKRLKKDHRGVTYDPKTGKVVWT